MQASKLIKNIQIFKIPFYNNSFYLILRTFFVSGSGFVFWFMASRLYSASDVGIASAMISLLGLLAMLSSLGFNITFMRFLPKEINRNDLICTGFSLSALIALLIILIIIFVNRASYVNIIPIDGVSYLCVYSFLAVFAPFNLLFLGVFNGQRKSKYALFVQNILFNRVFLLLLMTTFGFMGIILSHGIAMILSLIFASCLIYFKLGFKIKPIIDFGIVKKYIKYSYKNYFCNLLESIPDYLLPLLVLNMIGSEENAFFYIAWTISGLSRAIPRNISFSMIVEGAHNEEDDFELAKKAMLFSLIVVLAFVVAIIVFGQKILLLFGKEYTCVYTEMIIYVISTIPLCVNEIFYGLLRIKNKIEYIIICFFVACIITFGLSYFLIKLNYGTIGVGFAFFVANIIVLFYNYFIFRGIMKN